MSLECKLCNTYHNKFRKKMMDDFPKSSDVSKMTQRIPLETSRYQYCLKIAQIDGILWQTLKSQNVFIQRKDIIITQLHSGKHSKEKSKLLDILNKNVCGQVLCWQAQNHLCIMLDRLIQHDYLIEVGESLRGH